MGDILINYLYIISHITLSRLLAIKKQTTQKMSRCPGKWFSLYEWPLELWYSSVVPRPAAPTSLGSLLEIQILRSHHRPTESETQESQPDNLC